ncbi:unnamed protein product [Pieris macdunnoughi]|uniref:SH3 domain-containing protein n=1 Tax=Pieris macdunnoughi TaxID=345717 RepID=A0A821L9A0_9NEOP|nr:unnamed protein product [Pieris macdunnoughi]
MTATPPHPSPAPLTKQDKSRRKISLPWFRQSSVTSPHASLTRQHTIDTPSSFHARLLKGSRRQAGPEMTWVVADHISGGAGELTVSKGQQVEVLEAWQARLEWWVVRIHGDPPQEGAVPAQVLKPQPHQKTSPSRQPLGTGDEAIGKLLNFTVNNTSDLLIVVKLRTLQLLHIIDTLFCLAENQTFTRIKLKTFFSPGL